MRRETFRTSTVRAARPIYMSAILAVSVLMIGCQTYTTGLQKSEARGDEGSVIAALRTVATAQQSYAATNEGNYGTFTQLTEGSYLDARFGSENPTVHGYALNMTVGDKTFKCNAEPTAAGDLKGRHFYVDSTSPLIHVNVTQPASANDEIVKF